MKKHLFAIALLGLLSLQSTSGSALTMDEFSSICESAPGDCSDHRLLNAYVGGALDLLATLDGETDYLDTLYCSTPEELFDVPAVIRFMQRHAGEFATRNATLLVVRYFEERGGCLPYE